MSFGVILTVIFEVVVRVVAILSSSGTVKWWFLRSLRNPTGTVLRGREAEVAGMVAKGMTNKQIAQVLVLSLRTVESHVEHIFIKLGVTSRTQAAVLLAEQDRSRRAV